MLSPSELKKFPIPKDANWCAMSASADFKHIYAASCNNGGNGRIFASHNSGEEWTVTNSVKSKPWTQIATDHTGKFVVASCTNINGGAPGQIYFSVDYGWNWNITTAPAQSYEGVAMDSSGKYISATISNGQGLYYSHDYGVTWNFTIPDKNPKMPRFNFRRIQMSKSGQHQIAVSDSSGVFTSHDYGVSWNRTNQLNDHWLKGMSMDDTGKYQVMSVSLSGIYYSNDYGDHWDMFPDNPVGRLRDIVCVPPSCRVVYVANYDKLPDASDLHGELISGGVYKSTDYGKTWHHTGTPSGNGWTSLVVDSTGNKVIVGPDSSLFYRTIDGGKTWSRYGYEREYLQEALHNIGKGAIIGIIISILVLCCCNRRKYSQMQDIIRRQNTLIRSLRHQHEVLNRTLRSTISSATDEPVQATVELSPMNVASSSDVEAAVPSVTAIMLGSSSTTPSEVVTLDDEAAEKEQLLSGSSS